MFTWFKAIKKASRPNKSFKWTPLRCAHLCIGYANYCTSQLHSAAPLNSALCIDMNIEELFNKAVAEDISIADFESFSNTQNIGVEEAFNILSLLVARKFASGELSFEDGDYAMNGVWPIMLDHIMKTGLPVVEPCYEIYLAFDVGEYNHGDGADPVVKYTKPAIENVLKNA